MWASTIISSRAFTAKVLASAIPKLQELDDRVSVLLPLIDATNHKPLSRVEWQAGTDSIGLAVMAEVEAGDEIGNNYGPRNNEQCEYTLSYNQHPATGENRCIDVHNASDDELWLLYL